MYKVTWIGHSCFKVDRDGYTVVFDPSQDNYVPGIAPMREDAHMVICSHQHDDHNGEENINILEASAVEPYIITSLETFHDEEKGKLRGDNRITVLDDGIVRIAHFGDLGCIPQDEVLKELESLDIAMIPVGGYYTIDGMIAAQLVKMLKPNVVIPMHYRDDNRGYGFDVISTVLPFVDAIKDSYSIIQKEDSCLEYNHENPEKGVVVLIPQNLGN